MIYFLQVRPAHLSGIQKTSKKKKTSALTSTAPLEKRIRQRIRVPTARSSPVSLEWTRRDEPFAELPQNFFPTHRDAISCEAETKHTSLGKATLLCQVCLEGQAARRGSAAGAGRGVRGDGAARRGPRSVCRPGAGPAPPSSSV